MKKAKNTFILIVLCTWIFALLDWIPIHAQYHNGGAWPAWALGSFEAWRPVREWTAIVLCPPCAPLAENYYFVLMEVQASEDEQAQILPVHYSGNPLAPDGPRYWWGQGKGADWRPVSMLAWYLYWLPYTVLWWWLYASDLLSGRWPWWINKLITALRREIR